MNYNILVVEDERTLLQAIEKKLVNEKFNVLKAASFDQAIEILKDNSSIHAVWLDHYLMGKETGIDFVATLKADTEWKKIPIFVVSNTANPDNIKQYIHFGVEKYYIKSDSPMSEIIADIKETLEKNH